MQVLRIYNIKGEAGRPDALSHECPGVRLKMASLSERDRLPGQHTIPKRDVSALNGVENVTLRASARNETPWPIPHIPGEGKAYRPGGYTNHENP